jgi:hypothetical protein
MDWKRLWCALRGHPYPPTRSDQAYRDWLDGNEPFAPDWYCSHCGAVRSDRWRGMHS